MKTTILTTIALTTLIASNVNAATFVMQAKAPSGLTVIQSNNATDTNFIEVDTNSNVKTGFYLNNECITNDNLTAFFPDSFEDTNFDNNTFTFIFSENGISVKFKTNYDLVIPEMVEAGYEAYAGHAIDKNGVLYFFDDLNANKIQDKGEKSFFVGEQFSWYDEGSEITHIRNGICLNKL